MNPEPNLAEWRTNVVEIVDNPRVSRYLGELDKCMHEYVQSLPQKERGKIKLERYDRKASMLDMAEMLLPEQDKSMMDYARNWADASRAHAEQQLYRKCVDFFEPQKGLLVDLGCGTGAFLSEVPFESVIGVDINHYCLQAADALLTQKGRQVNRYSRTYISFDPDRGFILKPCPVMEEIDLGKTNLLADDLANMNNTMRVLYNQGVKADMASFMLSGGYTNNSPLQFLDLMRLGESFWDKRRVQHGAKMSEYVIKNVGQVCRRGGRFFVGMRLHVQQEGGEDSDIYRVLAKNFAKNNPHLEVVRVSSTPITHEHKFNGISIDGRRQLPDGTLDVLNLPPENMHYDLYFFDTIVK